MLSHAFDPKGLTIRPHSHNELVIRHLCDWTFRNLWWRNLNIRRIILFGGRSRRSKYRLAGHILCAILFHADDFPTKVHIVGPSLMEADVLAQSTNGFQSCSELQRANCCRSQQRCEDEVGAWRDYDSLIFCGIEGPRKGITSPACS